MTMTYPTTPAAYGIKGYQLDDPALLEALDDYATRSDMDDYPVSLQRLYPRSRGCCVDDFDIICQHEEREPRWQI